MAIPKKKIAGKPAMKKAPMRKAKNGEEVAKSDTLANVTRKEKPLETLRKFYKRDFFNADKAKTEAGQSLRKIGNTAVKIAQTPNELMLTAGRLLNSGGKKKMGGKIAKKKK